MNKDRNSKFDILAVLLVICIFSVAILSLLLTGAKSYKGITQRDRISQNKQIVSLYLGNKLFQAQTRSSAVVYSENGCDVLHIFEPADDVDDEYITRIYYYDGWIRELYSDTEYEFAPGDGEKIAECSSLTFSNTDNVLTIEFVIDGESVFSYFEIPKVQTGGGI